MATIAENLQIISASLESIKTAIIGKGAAIPGDISTYAAAISNIEGGGGGITADDVADATISGSIGLTITNVNAYAFYQNSKITLVDAPNVTTISSYAFYDCSGMTEARFPKAKTLSTYSLALCSSLISIDAPNVTTLGSNSFRGCSSIRKVQFLNATSLNHTTFYSCSQLEIAEFASISNFASSTLAYCSSLKALVLRKTSAVITTVENAFSSSGITKGTAYIYVPSALLESYKEATNWSKFADQFRALEDYTVDGTIMGELDETKI